MRSVLEEETLSVAEAAELLKVSKSTLWRWIDRGDLPAYRVGRRRIRLKRTDIENRLVAARELRHTEVTAVRQCGIFFDQVMHEI